MSQRESGYERKALDQYETPSWVTLALVPHLPEPTLAYATGIEGYTRPGLAGSTPPRSPVLMPRADLAEAAGAIRD